MTIYRLLKLTVVVAAIALTATSELRAQFGEPLNETLQTLREYGIPQADIFNMPPSRDSHFQRQNPDLFLKDAQAILNVSKQHVVIRNPYISSVINLQWHFGFGESESLILKPGNWMTSKGFFKGTGIPRVSIITYDKKTTRRVSYDRMLPGIYDVWWDIDGRLWRLRAVKH